MAYVGCRKLDRPDNFSNAEYIKSRFFFEHAPIDPLTKSAADFVRRENDKYNFIVNLTKQIGFPRWNKAMIFPYVNSAAANRGNGGGQDSAAILYVPFSRDGQNFINSALILSLSSRDTLFQFLMDWQYDSLGYDTSATRTGWNAWDLFHLFTRFDNEVFGHTKFQILDSNLFRGDTVTAILVPDTISYQGRLEPTVLCSFYQIISCIVQSEGRSYSHGSGCAVSYTMYCTTTWVNIGDDPGGGGGGGGWTLPDPCQLQGGGLNGRLPPGCEGTGSGGWVPVGIDEPLPPTPPNDSTIAARLKRAYEKCQSTTDSLHGLANTYQIEYTFTYWYIRNDTIPLHPLPGRTDDSKPMLGTGAIGINHTHQDEGPTDVYRNQSFDGADIFKFYSHYVKGDTFAFQTITTRDYVYAAYVTDRQKFINYVRTICNSSIMDIIQDSLNVKHSRGMLTCPSNCHYNRQTEFGALYLSANNVDSISGIKIFKSPRQNINFTLLNP